MLFATLFMACLAAAVPTTISGTTSTVPDPSQVHIESVTYGGTGCPQGSLAYVISDDRTTMTLIFDSYVAAIGPGVPITESRKNCQLNIGIFYPAGFQFSLFQADYRGYVGLDAGVNGTQKSTYYFSGQTQQVSTESDFVGPMDQDYLFTDKAYSTSVVWSPCGAEGLLNINSQVRVNTNSKTASGQLTTDSIDTKFTQILYLNWQTCNKK